MSSEPNGLLRRDYELASGVASRPEATRMMPQLFVSGSWRKSCWGGGMQTQDKQKRCLNGDRVREHTPRNVLRRIDRMSEADVDAAVVAGRDAILRRLVKLDYEWDIDRALMVNFAIAGGASLSTGLLRYSRTPLLVPRRKGFLYFFGAQLGFLLLHGLVGWCPPVSVLRRLGYRTQREIEAERRDLRDALALTEPA